MNFAELPPSKQWAGLNYKGDKVGEVWLKPQGDPFAVTFRIPQTTFQTPGLVRALTVANLLKTMGIAAEEVESWRYGEFSHSGVGGPDSEFKNLLPPPPAGFSHLPWNPRNTKRRNSGYGKTTRKLAYLASRGQMRVPFGYRWKVSPTLAQGVAVLGVGEPWSPTRKAPFPGPRRRRLQFPGVYSPGRRVMSGSAACREPRRSRP
jgi:hypothetical protein